VCKMKVLVSIPRLLQLCIDKLHIVRFGIPKKANECPNVEGAESFVLNLDSNANCI
jgi:hypothetical protein